MRPEDLQENFYFGGGATATSFTAVTLVLLCVGLVLVLLLPRKWILLPFFLIGLMIPTSQVLVIPGMHLAVYRVLLLAIWVRIAFSKWLLRSDPYTFQMNVLDKVFVAWAICNAIMYSLLWHEVGALMNRLGFLSISLGVYFMLRWVIREREDVIFAIRTLALAVIPIAIAMGYEHFTGENLVVRLLGAGHQFAEIRNGRIRAQGPFAHSILAGTFGAILLALFVGLWREGKSNRFYAAMGVMCAAAMVWTSASSTPLMASVAGVVGFGFWPLRKHMRVIRWSIVLGLMMLQLVMKAPVWFVINRVSGLIGGTGWHRAELIDQFIKRFFEWFLVGTQNNASWGLDMWDAINAYVRAGVEGGLLTFILFLSLIVIAYRRVGRARAVAAEKDAQNEFFVWSFGVSLFANTVAFFGIIYFDQSVVGWYTILVMISVVTSHYLEAAEWSPVAMAAVEAPRMLRPSPVQAYAARLQAKKEASVLHGVEIPEPAELAANAKPRLTGPRLAHRFLRYELRAGAKK